MENIQKFKPVIEKVIKESLTNKPRSYGEFAQRVVDEIQIFAAMLEAAQPIAQSAACSPNTGWPESYPIAGQKNLQNPTTPAYEPINLQPSEPPLPQFDISQRMTSTPQEPRALSEEEALDRKRQVIEKYRTILPAFINVEKPGLPTPIILRLHQVTGAPGMLPIVLIRYIPNGQVAESQLIDIPQEVSKTLMSVEQVVAAAKEQALAKLFTERKTIHPVPPPDPGGALRPDPREEYVPNEAPYAPLGGPNQRTQDIRIVDLTTARSSD